MPKIAVIVPVYNVENYIRRCVDSILQRSYTDFVLILIDDGSPDNCGNICDEYAAEDSRIVVLHQKNGGVASARNAGIEWALLHTECEWLCFIDSDDYIHQDYLKTLYTNALSNNVAISMRGFSATHGEGLQTILPLSSGEVIIDTPENLWCSYRVNCTVAWSKIFNRSLFGNSRFPEGIICEDEFVVYKLFFAQEKVAFFPEALYAYYQSNDSITRKKWSCVKMMQPEAIRLQLLWFIYAGYGKAAKCNSREYIYYLYSNLHAANMSKEYVVMLRCLLREALHKFGRLACVSFWNSPHYYAAAYPALSPFCDLRLYANKAVKCFHGIWRKR